MRNKSLLSWIALCGILALATNALLVLHLWSCHNHSSDSCEPSSHHEPHPHNSQKCPICHILLDHSVKYVVETGAATFLTEPFETRSPLSCEEQLSQTAYSPSIPRGPPAV